MNPKSGVEAIQLAIEHGKFRNKIDAARLNNLRVSSFPFCATKWWFSLPLATNKTREGSFMGDFYTTIGTAIHTNIQRSATAMPYTIQDWRCSCGKVHEFCLKPKRCSCGQTEFFKDEEHEIRRGVIVGHIDNSFLLEDKTIDIVDYKSTTVRSLESKDALPHLENVRQIEAYCGIKIKDGFNISGWTLDYITRNSAQHKYVTSTQFYGHSLRQELPAINSRVSQYVKDYKLVSRLTTVEELKEVLRRRRLQLSKPDTENLCNYCLYKSVCTQPNRDVLAHAKRVFQLVKIPVINE